MEDYRTVIVAAGGAIVLIVAVSLVVVLVKRRRRRRAMSAPLPLIPFSSTSAVRVRPHAALEREVEADTWAAATTPARTASVGAAPMPDLSTYAPKPPARHSPDASVRTVPSNPLAGMAEPNDVVDGNPVDGASMRYWRAADGTLQFLPGRLAVIAGRDAGQEIRFVRTPGPDGTQVTFGRADGPPYRHVQLREPTVSRAHARMSLDPGGAGGSPQWRLENLSATNPVIVNGRPLGTDGAAGCAVPLAEGDRIEMGEVIFQFHEK